MEIRAEEPNDKKQIRELNEIAFARPTEADIIEELRINCSEILSLVAWEEDKIVGHIFFSPAIVDGKHGTKQGMGLAPLAVLPEYQRRGIGSELVKAGLEQLRQTHCPFVIVIGYSEYYSRFGFEQASSYGIKCQWDNVPDDAFMILWLDTSVRNKLSGTARYRDEFNEAV